MSLETTFSERLEAPAAPPYREAFAGPIPPIFKQTDFSDGAIAIRRFRPDDSLAHYSAVRESVYQLCSWMVWCHPRYSPMDSAAFIESCETGWDQDRQYCFVVEDADSGAFLGSVGLSQVNRAHNFANLGYWVRSSCTGRNIAPAAVRLAARFAFQGLGLHRLELLVPVANKFSRRVAEKVGAHREGVLRNRLRLQAAPHDAVLYSLVPKDLQG
jgi:ribosomal-protein-serine acetyltransferase